MGLLERIAWAVDAGLRIEVMWNGENLARLLDEEHAGIVEALIGKLRSLGWTAVAEVSFAIYGERGSIDILALHPATRTCLVVEVKSVVPDLQAMLSALDRKRRLAPRIARERGWEIAVVGTILALPSTMTSRRRIAAHTETFSVSFPASPPEVRRWLREPRGAIAGLLFVSPTRGVRPSPGFGGRLRVRVPKSRSMPPVESAGPAARPR